MMLLHPGALSGDFVFERVVLSSLDFLRSSPGVVRSKKMCHLHETKMLVCDDIPGCIVPVVELAAGSVGTVC